MVGRDQGTDCLSHSSFTFNSLFEMGGKAKKEVARTNRRWSSSSGDYARGCDVSKQSCVQESIRPRFRSKPGASSWRQKERRYRQRLAVCYAILVN